MIGSEEMNDGDGGSCEFYCEYDNNIEEHNDTCKIMVLPR
jgi:hypothetical protein